MTKTSEFRSTAASRRWRLALVFACAIAVHHTPARAEMITVGVEDGAKFDGALDGFPGIAVLDGEADLGENAPAVALKAGVTEERTMGEFPLPGGLNPASLSSASIVFNIDDVLSTFGPGTDFAGRAAKQIFLHVYDGDGTVALTDFKNIQGEAHLVDTTSRGTINDASLRTSGPLFFSVDVTEDVRALITAGTPFVGIVWRTNDSPTGTSIDNLGDGSAGPPGINGSRMPELMLEIVELTSTPTPTGTPLPPTATSTPLPPTETPTRRPPPTSTSTRTQPPTSTPSSVPTATASHTPSSPTPTVPFVRGDANCNGALDGADLDRLNALLFDTDLTAACPQADANGDGTITSADLPELVGLLAGTTQ